MVVVTHFEQADELTRTLAALSRQDVPVDRVVVTDDGSAVAPSVPEGVGLVTQPDRGFRAALARNRGVVHAGPGHPDDVLVFLDADTVPEPGLVGHLVRAVRADPDALVVGRRRHTRFGAVQDPGDDVRDAGEQDADPLAGAARHELEEPRWLGDGYRATDDLRRADDGSFRFFIAALFACRRSWFDRVGGFDETFVGYGGEDWDLAHRWWTAGGRLRHEPRAVGWHHGEHAGTGERRAADTRQRRTTETLAIARRVNAWPAAFRGLGGVPPRVVVTHDASLDDRELLVAVDGLLAADPHVRVRSDRPLWSVVADPRVGGPTDGVEVSAALHVRLHGGVRGDRDAWWALLATDLGEATHLRLVDDDGTTPLLTLSRLRRVRRAHLGLEAETWASAALPTGLRAIGDDGLDAWLGGWGGG